MTSIFDAGPQYGINSLSIGTEARATDRGGIAFGAYAYAEGDGAMAIGYQARAVGKGAVAIGPNVEAIGDGVVKIAEGALFTKEQLDDLRILLTKTFEAHGYRKVED